MEIIGGCLTCKIQELGEEGPGSGLAVNACLGHALGFQHDIAELRKDTLTPLPDGLSNLHFTYIDIRPCGLEISSK